MSIVRAQQMFRRFFKRDAEDDEIFDLGMKRPETVFVLGEVDSIIYRTENSKKPFIHRFTKSDRPFLLVSFDGRQIYMLKGAYRFIPERGFVG